MYQQNLKFDSIFLESTLHLVLRLRGGAKKRKKKNYTTPKKQKHKHKKVKLAVLKYYRVDDNGKVTLLPNSIISDGTVFRQTFVIGFWAKRSGTHLAYNWRLIISNPNL
jgi:hypothetical protein